MALDLALFPDKPQKRTLDLSAFPDRPKDFFSEEEEDDFQKWYKERARRLNINPDPDDPKHFYDYRAAFKAGAEPDDTGHWPSKFKLSGHPRTVVDGINTITGEPYEGPLDLSAFPDQPDRQDEDEESFNLDFTAGDIIKPVLDRYKRTAPKIADRAAGLIQNVAGAGAKSPLNFIKSLYSESSLPLAPVRKTKDVVQKVGDIFKVRKRIALDEKPATISAPSGEPRQLNPEQVQWENEINGIVNIEAQDLAAKLIGKKHPDLAAAQSGQKQLQVIADLGEIALTSAGTGLVTAPIKALPKIASVISKSPRLAHMVEFGASAIPYTAIKKTEKFTSGDQTIQEVVQSYPEETAKNMVGFMAFSAAGQLAGEAWNKAAFEKVVSKMPARSMVMTKDFVRDYYVLTGKNKAAKEFANSIPGFKELASKTFKTGEETLLVIPEKTITKLSARPWWQNLRKFLVKDITPVPERTLFEVGGKPFSSVVPREPLGSPAPGQAGAGRVLPSQAPAPSPLQPGTGEITAYNTVSNRGKMIDNFEFPQHSQVESFKTKEHRGEKVYTPDEIEQAAQREYITKDLGVFSKAFSDEVKRKADGKLLKDTPQLYIDFDDLKALNTKVGRTAANQMFQGFAKLLNEYGFTANRWGGDEFSIIMNPVKPGESDPREVFDRFVKFQEDLQNLTVKDDETGEILHTGMTLSSGFGLDVEEADAAAKAAKEAGKNQVSLDKSFVRRYDKVEGTNYAEKWTEKETRLTARGEKAPGAEKKDVRLAREPSAGSVRSEQELELKPAEPASPPEKRQPPNPKASYTPLLNQLVPQPKQLAGEMDIMEFVRSRGKIKPGPEDSGELKSLEIKRIIDKKNGKPLSRFVEGAIEAGYIPEDAGPDEFLALIEKQDRTGEKQFPLLKGAEIFPVRPVSSLTLKDMDEAIQDFENLAAQRPLTDIEQGIFSNLKETRKQKTPIALNLELFPDQPVDQLPQDLTDLPPEVQYRIKRVALEAQIKSGEVYEDLLAKAGDAFRQEEFIKGRESAMELVRATESSLGMAPPTPRELSSQNIQPVEETPPSEKPKKKRFSSGTAALSAPSQIPPKPEPTPEPGEPGTGEETPAEPENPVYPGAPINFVPHIEMPELYRLAKQILGNPPLVKKLRKNLGLFKNAKGEKKGQILLDRNIFKNPVEATKVLAHEIGHLIDWLPEYTLSRGNVLGRLKSLIKYRRTVLDPLPTANDAINPINRNKIRGKAVIKALRETDYSLSDYIKKPEIRKSMTGLVEQKYEELIQAEINRLGLITKKEVMEELKSVTDYWHPFDPNRDEKYTFYRYSARELYAESISMLFNEPVRLKEMAPKFWKTFWDNLKKKPEVEKALLELDQLLSDESKVLQARQDDVRAMFRNGEELFFNLRKERSLKKRNLWLTLKEELIDKNTLLIDKVKQIQKSGRRLNPEDNPVYYLEEYNYIGGKIHNLLDRYNSEIVKKAADLGISQQDIGEYLLLRRVLAERKDIANPLGINRMTADKSLKFLLSGKSEVQKAQIESSIKSFDQMIQEKNLEALKIGLYTPEIGQKITTNDSYATFQVLDYLNDYVTASVIHQVGTFKEIANPLTSSLLKLISVTRAIERERTRQSVVKFMKDNFPGEIEPAEIKFLGMKGDIPITEFREKDDKGIIVTHEAGKRLGWYVDPHIADSVNYQPQPYNSAIVNAIKWANRSWFRPIYINLNLGFQLWNLQRDFWRSWKLNPDRSLLGHIAGYFKAAPDAASRVWGKQFSQTIKEMQEQGMLAVTYNDLTRGVYEDETQLEAIMRKWGIGPGDFKQRNKNPFMAMMSVIEDLGNFIETLPKVNGYKGRLKSNLKIKEIAHAVRVYSGSPDFLRRGKGYWWYNEVFLFSNAIKEGIRGDIEGAFRNPRTRAGYWWKTFAVNILPKIAMFLGGAGFFGKKIKDNFDRQTEYDKTNYTTVPVGMTDNDQAVYLRLPQDEVGRMIAGIFWKGINANDDFIEAAKQIAGLTAGQIPSQAPILEIATVMLQYGVGQNPYDFYRGRTLLTDEEQEVRGAYGARKIGRWFLNKSGASVSWGYQDKPGDDWLIKFARYTPVVSRFIKITDYGLDEKRRVILKKKRKAQAEKTLIRRKARRESRGGSSKGVRVR